MKIKQLIKSYSFWTALAGAVVMLTQALGRIFGFSVENEAVSDFIMSIAGILVVCGIVKLPKSEESAETKTDEALQEKNEEKKDKE